MGSRRLVLRYKPRRGPGVGFDRFVRTGSLQLPSMYKVVVTISTFDNPNGRSRQCSPPPPLSSLST